MEIHSIVLIAVVAALVGAVAAYLIFHKRGTVNDDSSSSRREDDYAPSKDEEIVSQKKEIEGLNNKIDELKQNLKEAQDFKDLLKSGDENVKLSALNEKIKKLQKKIEKTEDELDKAEDELEKANKSEKKRFSDLKSEFDKQKKEIESLNERLGEKEGELQDKNEEVVKKKEAISFVNEILQAKNADDEDYKKLSEKVNRIQDFICDKFFAIFDNLQLWNWTWTNTGEIIKKEDIEYRLWSWKNLQLKIWLRGKKVIAFVGEFSAGKTSIVNRILSQDNDNAPKLPVSSKATTAIPTYISYGSDFNSQFTNPDGQLKNISKSTFEKVNKEILQQVNVSPLIQYFVMSYRNENLQGLSILDTPGFNSNDKEDANRTVDVIKEADALFWVMDANTGEINKTSIGVIRQHLGTLPLYVIINKADDKSPNELQKLEDHIKTTMQRNGIQVSGYLRFSRQKAIDELMNVISGISGVLNDNSIVYAVYNMLSTETKNSEKECKDQQHECTTMENNVNYDMNSIGQITRDISDSCTAVVNLPEQKKSWFGLGSDYFKMTVEGYSQFVNILNEIKGQGDGLSGLASELSNDSRAMQQGLTELGNMKEKRKTLKDALVEFEKILGDWNPNWKKEFKDFMGN